MATAPMITAHSGCEGTNRDSLDSVLRAIELGVDAVEVDVRKSPDGVLRISHDKKLTAEQYASHATLEEVFRLLRPTSLSINCDVKEREHLYTLLNLAKQYGFGKERLILSGSVSPEQLAYDTDITNQATLYMNIEEIFKYLYLYTGSAALGDFSKVMTEPWAFTRIYMKTLQSHLHDVIELAHLLRLRTINFPYQYLTEENCATLDDAGLSVSVWTVDDQKALETYLSYSVSNLENITTRRVGIMKNLLSLSMRNQTAPSWP